MRGKQMIKYGQKAPELTVSQWLNVESDLSLSQLQGKVVVLHAFQMLCPGCVTHGIPQAAAVAEMFSVEDVQVIGLHTVFEHHDVMTVAALQAFLQEYRVQFPVAVDQVADHGPIPKTMQAYGLEGTPSLILIDRSGRIRLKHFGRLSDMQLGSMIGQLICEEPEASAAWPEENSSDQKGGDCSPDGCRV